MRRDVGRDVGRVGRDEGLEKKKAKARTYAKKSNNTAFVRNPGVENLRVLDLGIQKLSTKILGCLPPPHST